MCTVQAGGKQASFGRMHKREMETHRHFEAGAEARDQGRAGVGRGQAPPVEERGEPRRERRTLLRSIMGDMMHLKRLSRDTYVPMTN